MALILVPLLVAHLQAGPVIQERMVVLLLLGLLEVSGAAMAMLLLVGLLLMLRPACALRALLLLLLLSVQL